MLHNANNYCIVAADQKVKRGLKFTLYLFVDQVSWPDALCFKRHIQQSTLSHVPTFVTMSQIWNFIWWLEIQNMGYLKHRP